MNVKLYGVTFTRNEELRVPYVMKYLQELGYDRLIVYDNESTDRTVELLKEYPFVELRTLPRIDEPYPAFEDQKQDITMSTLWELNAYHNGDGGYIEGVTEPAWFTVTDFDEVPYYIDGIGNFKMYLTRLTQCGYNVCYETMPCLLGERTEYDVNEFIHRQIDRCFFYDPLEWNKPILFRLDNIRWAIIQGGHHFAGFNFYGQPLSPFTNSRHYFVFHLKYTFGDNFWKIPDGSKYEFKQYVADSISFNSYWEHKILNGLEPMGNGFLSPVFQISDDGTYEGHII